jgi:hypothetical protein
MSGRADIDQIAELGVLGLCRLSVGAVCWAYLAVGLPVNARRPAGAGGARWTRIATGAAQPPNPPPKTNQPAARSAVYTLWDRLVGNTDHRSPHLRVLGDRCPSTHAIPHAGPTLPTPTRTPTPTRATCQFQFLRFGPRSCFGAFVMEIPNGLWPLGGPLYISR